ncbi:MAG: DUF3175 domain-containing protein [Halobacteriales archaeon]|nr:DUF3175 domain-containing protein [Halobacteriales archaeon]
MVGRMRSLSATDRRAPGLRQLGPRPPRRAMHGDVPRKGRAGTRPGKGSDAKRRVEDDARADRRALPLEPGLFTLDDPKAIARNLHRAAIRRGGSDPFGAAMATLDAHVKRSSRGLAAIERRGFQRVRMELRQAFGRRPQARRGDPRWRPPANRGARRPEGRKVR